MVVGRYIGWSLLVGAVILGCGDDRRAAGVTGPEGGVIRFDAAMVTWDGGAFDGGQPTMRDAGVESDAGVGTDCEASFNPQGILTNRPDMSFLRTGGSLVATTFFVHGFEEGGAAVFAEVMNDGASTVCIPLATIRMDGVRLSGVVDGPAYEYSSSLTTVCAPPGGTVVMHGVSADLPPGYAEAARAIEYSTSGLTSTTAIPSSARPVIRSADFATSDSGRLLIRGQAFFPETIRNVKIAFFVRNDCGLITGSVADFHLDTAVAGLAWDFEAAGLLDPVQAGVPTDWIYASSFIQD